MSAYLLSVIGTVLLSAILTAIAPEGKTSGIVKGVTRLACILVIIAPVPAFLKSAKSTESATIGQNFFTQTVIQTDEEFIKYYKELRIRNAQTEIAEELTRKFSVNCTVALTWTEEETEQNESEIRITRISVKTNAQASEEAKKQMAEHLKKNYCSEVLIE